MWYYNQLFFSLNKVGEKKAPFFHYFFALLPPNFSFDSCFHNRAWNSLGGKAVPVVDLRKKNFLWIMKYLQNYMDNIIILWT